jgi:hypothetical protein
VVKTNLLTANETPADTATMTAPMAICANRAMRSLWGKHGNPEGTVAVIACGNLDVQLVVFVGPLPEFNPISAHQPTRG